MHQQPRPPKVSSPAAKPQPQSRPSRANIPPREAALGSRSRAGSTVRSPLHSPTSETPPTFGPPADSVKKLDQIIQNFYAKCAALVLDSRMRVKPKRDANGVRKLNKWFQIDTDEIDDFREELKIWKNCGSVQNLPPSMAIEVYLDISKLKDSQSLVIVDEDGKRWDVLEQLNSSGSSSGNSLPRKNAEVILERWRVDLKHTGITPTDDFGPILPTIYKKAIVFFRSLFATTRLLPAWKFASLGPVKNSHPALIPRCRIRMSEPGRQCPDRLRSPIDGRSDPVTEYMFGDLEVPVGRLCTTVTYRNDCNFRVDDSESLLSSRFMGVDENFFKPSLPQRSSLPREPTMHVGSRDNRVRPSFNDVQQPYGSLSTFHGNNPLGASPISALRAVRVPGSDTSSPPSSFPRHDDPDVPHSLPTGQISAPRPSMRTAETSSRRPSMSFQPFKAGSLSSSPVPRHTDGESPASPHSLTRPPGIPSLSQPRNRTSLIAGMPASLRGGPPPAGEIPIAGSPRPTSTSRYSSSFTHRRGRLSFGGASRAGDDEQGSSGRQSLASSVVQPGSGLLAETGGGTSSGSLQNEDDNISDFLKALDSKKTLKSFEVGNRGDSATNRTVAQLSRFHMMRDSNNALTESMSSSVQMQRSSSSSSRQLASVPGMAAPASLSTSSSPSKPLSPHTPHTPAIPSRLSENSIIDYTGHGRISSRHPEGALSGPCREETITQDGTTAIDIPLSPRLDSYQRRASSGALQNRALGDEDDTDLAFAHRSISLGGDDRDQPPTMSTLLGRRMQDEGRDGQEGGLQPAAEIQATEGSSDMLQTGSAEDNPPEGLIPVAPSSSPFGRRRYMGMGAPHRGTPPQSSRGSFTGSNGRLARGDDESAGEEPLVFDLSEMDAQSRRSLEEGRSISHAAPGVDRGNADGRGASRRGW